MSKKYNEKYYRENREKILEQKKEYERLNADKHVEAKRTDKHV